MNDTLLVFLHICLYEQPKLAMKEYSSVTSFSTICTRDLVTEGQHTNHAFRNSTTLSSTCCAELLMTSRAGSGWREAVSL